ncbi:hypothetical protein [Streptomyces sp. NPDC096030]|uniref:hypothetical protein n=1 Tax=Streptomyces sp. NPDC096030 TaxID=3155423 RepID=UPI00332A8873
MEVLLGALLAIPALRANAYVDISAYPAISERQLCRSVRNNIAHRITEPENDEPEEE